MKLILRIFLFIFLCTNIPVFSDSGYQYLGSEEKKMANFFIDKMKQGDFKAYNEYMLKNRNLFSALKICKFGLKDKLQWDPATGRYIRVEKDAVSKYGIGKLVADFLERTQTIVMFTKGFGSQSETGGITINGHWQQGELTFIGAGEKKYKIRKFNVVWISEDLKKSPAAIALILAHEVGHGLAYEFRDNYYPLPYDEAELKKAPYIYFPVREQKDDNMWCYPFEGMMAEELGITTLKEMHLYTGSSVKISHDAMSWYTNVIGSKRIKFPRFYDRLRINTCLQRKLEYLNKKHVCGMRCKYFDQYGFCDNPVKIPPCHLWKEHLEGWLKE